MIIESDLTLTYNNYEKKVTIYADNSVVPKASILYFHGGGLLYGTRKDLPDLHIETLTGFGFKIIAFDYPLAPAIKLDAILEDVIQSIIYFYEHPDSFSCASPDYFLWGRSAGAYLCLMAGVSEQLKLPPKGILSYYGYGLLCDQWFHAPCNHYNTFPKVPESCIQNLPTIPYTEGNMDEFFSVYVYARQTGLWKDLIYEGRDKYLYLNYSLRTYEQYPCPLFCAHSIQDPDVPYSEFLALCSRYNPQRFVAAKTIHDFDRDTSDPTTEQLLDATVRFLNQHLDSIKTHEKY